MKNKHLLKLKEYIIPKDAEIQVAAFNILAVCGIIVSIITAVVNTVSGNNPLVVVADLAGVVVSWALIVFCHKTGNYKMAMTLTAFIIFIGLFTALYFIQGGYHSGIPAFFIFGIVFTAFLLNGGTMVVLIAVELIWYVCLILYSYYNPQTLNDNEKYYMIRVVLDMTLVALSLAITMYFQIRVYRKNQQKLSEAILAAKEANRAKSDFLAKMSHDIRTPLNTIMAMNEMIVSNTSSARIREWVNDSNVSGRILISLIDDMLDLTRIEAGRMELLEQPWDTRALFEGTAKACKLQADKKGLEFRYDINDAVPEYLSGDEDVIRKITNNLLSNAVKYTRNGVVSLTVRWEQELKIIVADTGVGIAPEYLEKIFKPFERGVQEIYKETSGSGLGLAIVKELVDAVGGSIDCQSVLERGTVFTVSLPQKESNKGEEREKKEKETAEGTVREQFIAPDARILVVDDNAFNRKVIEGFLEQTLIQVDDVESGYEALEMIDIREYDLILMDFRMPDMDGAETLDKIREEYPDLKTPVIVLTADIMNGVEERMLERGFAAFLPKPVNSAKLYEVIAQFIPDKVVALKTEQDNGLTLARMESYQELFKPYGIDLKLALEYNAGNTEEFLNRAELFDEYADENISHLKEPESEERYYLQIHAIKSIAKGVGAYLLSQLAETAELRKDIDFSKEISPVIIEEYERVRSGLRRFRTETNAQGGNYSEP